MQLKFKLFTESMTNHKRVVWLDKLYEINRKFEALLAKLHCMEGTRMEEEKYTDLIQHITLAWKDGF